MMSTTGISSMGTLDSWPQSVCCWTTRRMENPPDSLSALGSWSLQLDCPSGWGVRRSGFRSSFATQVLNIQESWKKKIPEQRFPPDYLELGVEEALQWPTAAIGTVRRCTRGCLDCPEWLACCHTSPGSCRPDIRKFLPHNSSCWTGPDVGCWSPGNGRGGGS